MAEKFAFVYNTSTDDVSQTMTTMEQAVALAEAGHRVEIYFDGRATTWPGHLADNPDNPVTVYYRQAKERGLIGGACGLCSVNFDAVEALREEGVEILGDHESHGVDSPALVERGFDLQFVT